MAKGRIIVTESGRVQVFIDEGEYSEASKEVEEILNLLQSSGINFNEVNPVERHRHDHDGNHVHEHSQ